MKTGIELSIDLLRDAKLSDNECAKVLFYFMGSLNVIIPSHSQQSSEVLSSVTHALEMVNSDMAYHSPKSISHEHETNLRTAHVQLPSGTTAGESAGEAIGYSDLFFD